MRPINKASNKIKHKSSRNFRHPGRRKGDNPNSSSRDAEFTMVPGGRAYQKAIETRDRYLELAKEVLTTGDRVAAENYFQHADHYNRLINAAYEQRQRQRRALEEAGEGQEGAQVLASPSEESQENAADAEEV